MEPKTDEESNRTPDDEPDDAADITDEVPIVRASPGTKASDGDVSAAPEAPDGAAGEDVAVVPDDAPAAAPEDDVAAAPEDEVTAAGEDLAAAPEDDVAAIPDDETSAGPAAADAATADDVEEWPGLAPLDPGDLEALDPSVLESDLQEDNGEIVDLAGPADMGPASRRTADDLTEDTVLRGRSRPPVSGWRRLVYEVTGGLVRPRVSRSERERAEQLRLIRTLVTHPRRITVLSRKGGVGKTTTTLMLGQTLASERGDRIVAVDGNPDAGNLGYRIGPHKSDASITDLLNELDSVQRYADMRRFTAQTNSGLEVLMSDDDPHISTALGEQEYTAVTSLLDRFYNLILIDTGTGILDSAVQGILDGTDQVVLVVAPSLDAARAASQTLDWLTEHGFVGLVESAVTVINQTRSSALVDIARIEEHFWDRCGATVRVPWDRYLEAGAETELADLRPATREAYVQLAAAVARRFET